MANPQFIPTTIDDTLLATTLSDYRKILVDNVYNSNEVLKMLNSNKRMVDGGGSITESLIKERQTDGGFYLGADVLNNVQAHTVTLVEYRWQNSYEPILITRDEERSNSGSEHKILELVGTKMLLAEKAIQNRMEQALTTPVGEANNLIDLETLVNTGTLGTIAGGVSTFWQSTVTASGLFATQGLADMTTATYAVASSSTIDMPTHYLTNKTIFQRFEQTRSPLERQTMGNLTANAGFVNLTFKGRPLIYGNYVNTGLLFGLNMNYISLVVDSASDFITTQFITPTNQTVKVAYIIWRGNMTTNNRRRQFKLTDLT